MEEEEKSVLTGNTPNVMIQLLHNLAVFWGKNAIFSAQIFGEIF
jgi:hypothetical protein